MHPTAPAPDAGSERAGVVVGEVPEPSIRSEACAHPYVQGEHADGVTAGAHGEDETMRSAHIMSGSLLALLLFLFCIRHRLLRRGRAQQHRGPTRLRGAPPLIASLPRVARARARTSLVLHRRGSCRRFRGFTRSARAQRTHRSPYVLRSSSAAATAVADASVWQSYDALSPSSLAGRDTTAAAAAAASACARGCTLWLLLKRAAMVTLMTAAAFCERRGCRSKARAPLRFRAHRRIRPPPYCCSLLALAELLL